MPAALAFAPLPTLFPTPAPAAEPEENPAAAFSIACPGDPGDPDGYDERPRQAGFEARKRGSGRTKDAMICCVTSRRKPKDDFCGGSVEGGTPVLRGRLVLQDLKARGFQIQDAVRKNKETAISAAFGQSRLRTKIFAGILGHSPKLLYPTHLPINRIN